MKPSIYIRRSGGYPHSLTFMSATVRDWVTPGTVIRTIGFRTALKGRTPR